MTIVSNQSTEGDTGARAIGNVSADQLAQQPRSRSAPLTRGSDSELPPMPSIGPASISSQSLVVGEDQVRAGRDARAAERRRSRHATVRPASRSSVPGRRADLGEEPLHRPRRPVEHPAIQAPRVPVDQHAAEVEDDRLGAAGHAASPAERPRSGSPTARPPRSSGRATSRANSWSTTIADAPMTPASPPSDERWMSRSRVASGSDRR